MKRYQLVTRFVSSGNSVLDWGVGNGHFSYFLVRAGYSVSSFRFDDYPKVCGALASESYTHRKENPSGSISLPYENQVFDAIVSVGMLERVRETGGNSIASLNEIYRILKLKGMFLCFYFFSESVWLD